ncbi:MAG: inner membrane CreD family protein [Comamonadaceae bacterium]|nr:inner membrane CreD family protein [Comamonadaceae bacterium]
MKHPVFLKIMAVGGVLLMLIFGLDLIGGIVRDRQVHREAATSSVAQSLAGSQTLIGPLLHRSCVETWDVTTGSDASQTRTEQRREFALTALPDDLNVTPAPPWSPAGAHKVNTSLGPYRWPTASLQPQATVSLCAAWWVGAGSRRRQAGAQARHTPAVHPLPPAATSAGALELGHQRWVPPLNGGHRR